MIKLQVHNIDSASARLGALSGKLHSRVMSAVRISMLEVEARAKQKLSGEVLHVRTGVLRSSVTSKVYDDGKSIVGAIGTNVSYGRIHEYGFKGMVTVGDYMRRTKAQMKKATYTIKKPDGSRIYKVRMTGKHGVGTGETLVRQHQRMMNLPERSFLRSSLHELEGRIRQHIMDAVKGLNR